VADHATIGGGWHVFGPSKAIFIIFWDILVFDSWGFRWQYLNSQWQQCMETQYATINWYGRVVFYVWVMGLVFVFDQLPSIFIIFWLVKLGLT